MRECWFNVYQAGDTVWQGFCYTERIDSWSRFIIYRIHVIFHSPQ
jgi:hypothetical protein